MIIMRFDLGHYEKTTEGEENGREYFSFRKKSLRSCGMSIS